MASRLDRFERIARKISVLAQKQPAAAPTVDVEHPFDVRNIHPGLPAKVRRLFDDGYFAEATFEACKYLDRYVSKQANVADSGWKLMMTAFDKSNPKLRLTPLSTQSEIDEQEGFKFIFGSGVWAIRNPRGHQHSVVDDPDICLDHLSFISMLLRRLEQAGYK